MNAQLIEEIADVLCKAKEHQCDGGEDCLCVKQAMALYNAGYTRTAKDIAEAYQQGHSDGMQAAKEIGKCRIISYSDDITPVMTIEEEEEVITTTKFDIY